MLSPGLATASSARRGKNRASSRWGIARRKARLVFHGVAASQSLFASLFRELADSLFAVIFPTACTLCGQELSEAGLVNVCRNCWASLEPWVGPACPRCGIPYASEQALDSSRPLCLSCREEVFEFDLARTYGPYAGRLRAAILQLKFQRRQRLGRRLGELLASAWGWVEMHCGAEPPLLVPVPLHASRERERGFNQAELLAQGLSRKVGERPAGCVLRVETRCVRRVRATAPQTGLSLHQRHENVRGAFAVVAPERIRDRVVLLVDDVMTTGATVSACAGALKRAGAQAVIVLTLARATPQFPDTGTTAPGGPVDDSARARR